MQHTRQAANCFANTDSAAETGALFPRIDTTSAMVFLDIFHGKRQRPRRAAN